MNTIQDIELGLFREGLFPESPKQLELVSISAHLASKLNDAWHSRLPYIHPSNITRNRNYICFATMFDWRYFSTAIWSSPVNQSFNIDSVLELRRLAISPESPKFTATWMLSKMIKDIQKKIPRITRLISYQDTAVHTGTIYKAANWENKSTVKYRAWDKSRERNKPQSESDKIRWEYLLNNKGLR